MSEHANTLANQTVLVLGLGQSGLAMARWCSEQGAQVWVMDSRAEPPMLAALRTHCPQSQCVLGPFDPAVLQRAGVRAVFKSPGLTPQEVAPIWLLAQQMGLWVGTELSLFVHALAHLKDAQDYRPQVLAITGTNGKTTVTALTGQLLKAAGITAAVAGNIGPNVLDTLRERAHDLPAVWVLELSSFQLDGVDNFEPTAATLLNLSEDHLDWHGDMPAYTKAKANIWGGHGLLLFNRDDAQVRHLLPSVPEAKKKSSVLRPLQSFGAGLPPQQGDWGLDSVNGMTWLVRLLEKEGARKKSRQAVLGEVDYDDDEPFLQRLMPADALRIQGQHNALNALAALALASAVGGQLGPMLYALRQYRGEPHRTASVAVVGGVEYINDSKGTNVGATVAALQGFGQDRRLVLIAGGDGKGQNFAPLLDPVRRCARAVVLIGRDAPLLREALQHSGVTLVDGADMAQAVHRAAELAQSGDAVLLSPACASFDMFDNYGHRGDQFVLAVQAVALHAGQVWEGA